MAIDPLTAINTAATVAQTVGGFLGGGGEGLSRADQRFLADKSWKLADAQFYHPVQTRAADAQAAGLHPLAALGMSPTNAPLPIGFMGSEGPSLGQRLQEMGQNVSRAIQTQSNIQSRAFMDANLRRAKAEANIAEANAIEAMRRVINPPGNPPPAPSHTDRFGFTSGDVGMVGPKNVLIKNADGSYSLEESPQYGSTLYHRPISSSGRDLIQIVKDAIRGGADLWRNTISHRSVPKRKYQHWEMR